MAYDSRFNVRKNNDGFLAEWTDIRPRSQKKEPQPITFRAENEGTKEERKVPGYVLFPKLVVCLSQMPGNNVYIGKYEIKFDNLSNPPITDDERKAISSLIALVAEEEGMREDQQRLVEEKLRV